MWIRAFAAVVALVAACSFAVPPANATPDTAVTAWFQQGRCPAFNGPYKPEPPFARNTNEQLGIRRIFTIRSTALRFARSAGTATDRLRFAASARRRHPSRRPIWATSRPPRAFGSERAPQP
jgi:hypothetical protein